MDILIQGEFWGKDCPKDEREDLFVGRVVAMFRDLEGNDWYAFETADQLGVQVIAAGSVFYKGETKLP